MQFNEQRVLGLDMVIERSAQHPGRLAEMRDAGFDLCLEKPVRRDALFKVILGILSRRVEN